MAKFLIHTPIPNEYLGFGYRGLVFIEIIVDYIETWTRDSLGITVPKWVLIKIGRKHPKCPKIYLLNCLPNTKKFGS